MQAQNKWLILSPFLVIALGYLTATVFNAFIGEWAWVPLALVYWSSMAYLISRVGGIAAFRRWLRKPEGGHRWSVLAMAVAVLPLPVLLLNWRVLDSAWLITLWALTALINGTLEEGYWRGVMHEATASWPAWASVAYTSLLFTASHPLMWGVFSVANQAPITWGAVFAMGVAWAVVMRRTGSMRWALGSHILVDLFNLAVPVFLNLVVAL